MPGGSISGATTHNFITLKGEIQSLAQVVGDISRPGVDGHAYRRDAKRGKLFEMIGLADFASQGDAVAAYIELCAMQGTLVDVIDDRGTAGDEIMLLEVEREALEPMRASVGGLVANSEWLQRVRFRMQKTTPPASP